MKIGITTFQYAYNFGAILQLLAMQKLLTQLGHEAEAINFLPTEAARLAPWQGWKLREGNFKANVTNRLISFRYGESARKNFELFVDKNINISEPLRSHDQVTKYVDRYDAVVTGSDQVWNFNRSSVYFLDFGTNYLGKRISYAPSCGTLDQREDRSKSIGAFLNEFDSISVRDSISEAVVSKVCDKPVSIVADPTLMVDISDSEIKVDKPDKYIFMYVLGKEINGGHQNMINSIRKHYGDFPVVAAIASAHKPQRIDVADITIYDAGPGEWLNLVKNASFVYTDSFHCSLFSMKSGKDFIAYFAEEGRAPRLTDIASRYGVSRSIAGSVDEAEENQYWKQETHGLILDKIETHVSFSRDFLIKAL